MAEGKSGAQGDISIFDGRPDSATSWDLPPWGHKIGCRVFPLLIHLTDRLIPIGTAFCISRIGLVATATHNAREAIKRHPRGSRLLQMKDLPSNVELGNVSLSVLHNSVSAKDKLRINIRPLEGAQGAQPTDLLFGFPNPQQEFPYLPLPISLALPRIGSKVYCVGYRDTKLAAAALSLERIKQGDIDDWSSYYQHRLHVVEGAVTNIFTQEFTTSYLRGACFSIDAEVASGMSGGPVFNEEGYVCGIVSATASHFFDHPTSLVSLFYPAMMTSIKFGFRLAEQGRFNRTQPLLSLIDRGAIVTDGSETMVTFCEEETGWRIGPLVHKDDSLCVFDNFCGLQEGRTAATETRSVFQLKKKDDSGEG